eukprot:3917518-Prymnesium_polylepis.1
MSPLPASQNRSLPTLTRPQPQHTNPFRRHHRHWRPALMRACHTHLHGEPCSCSGCHLKGSGRIEERPQRRITRSVVINVNRQRAACTASRVPPPSKHDPPLGIPARLEPSTPG